MSRQVFLHLVLADEALAAVVADEGLLGLVGVAVPLQVGEVRELLVAGGALVAPAVGAVVLGAADLGPVPAATLRTLGLLLAAMLALAVQLVVLQAREAFVTADEGLLGGVRVFRALSAAAGGARRRRVFRLVTAVLGTLLVLLHWLLLLMMMMAVVVEARHRLMVLL